MFLRHIRSVQQSIKTISNANWILFSDVVTVHHDRNNGLLCPLKSIPFVQIISLYCLCVYIMYKEKLHLKYLIFTQYFLWSNSLKLTIQKSQHYVSFLLMVSFNWSQLNIIFQPNLWQTLTVYIDHEVLLNFNLFLLVIISCV